MAYEDFKQALQKYYKFDENPEAIAANQHYKFALSSNTRAQKFLTSVKKNIGDISGKKVLDIGCAYGGFCVESSKLGAESWGVDIVERNHAFAKENAKGIDNVTFKLLDITSSEALDVIPQNYFDIVVINDVLEHVYDTATMMKHLTSMVKDGGLYYFCVPNGNCIDFATKEGHKNILGLSILDPSQWSSRFGKPFSIYYRPLDYYLAIFNYYGFKNYKKIVHYSLPVEQTKERIGRKLAMLDKKVHEDLNNPKLNSRFHEALSYKYDMYKNYIEYDLKRLSDEDLHEKYIAKFWKGTTILSKK